MNTSFAFSHPIYVMLKPAGARCNMRCDYCYYLEKSRLYADKRGGILTDSLLEKFIQEYLEAQSTPTVLFTWHGGETLLRPLTFYKKALELQRRFARGRQIVNSIQTNGTLLTDEWCEFFRENNFLVGISIDGPQAFHDEYRHMAEGHSTSFEQVMHGIGLLRKHQVEWNALAVVNDSNANHPQAFYRFFKEIGCQYLQFTPVVERTSMRRDGLSLLPGMKEGGSLAPYSIKPEQWGTFLCTVFDEWVRQDVGTFFIRIFDDTLANWVGAAPGTCSLSKYCGHAGVMEFNGDLFSCDHFVFPEYRLGNLRDKTITEMMYSDRQKVFSQMKRQKLPRQCRECDYLFACNGECPRNRFVRDRYGNFGLNYLCGGYRCFFEHAAPYMDFMKQELINGRPPSNVMRSFLNNP